MNNMKRKLKTLITIVCVVGLVLGGGPSSDAQSVEACQAMGFLCGGCYGVVETACEGVGPGPFILADCNGEGTTGTVTDVTGSYIAAFETGIGQQCVRGVALSECNMWYEYECDGTTQVGVKVFYRWSHALCGPICYIA